MMDFAEFNIRIAELVLGRIAYIKKMVGLILHSRPLEASLIYPDRLPTCDMLMTLERHEFLRHPWEAYPLSQKWQVRN